MRYVALPRGINVTGSNMIKMTELKAAFESLGFGNVVTYINSGNVAFDSKKTAEGTLVKKIAPLIEKLAGKPISVMVRSQNDIKKILAADPFAGKYEIPQHMHVLFMDGPMSADKVKLLEEQQTDREKFIVNGNEIYALLLGGVAESMLGKGFIERKLKTTYTGRNWRTVEKLASL
jgi:uncharacterized protein (DUF1697 family)